MKDEELLNKHEAQIMESNKQLALMIEEKEKRAAELLKANIELEHQNNEKEKRAVELLRSNEDLKRTEAKLLEVNKELEAFSYSVSHDLRAPLRAIGSYSQMLEEDYINVLDENGQRLLGIIQKSAVKMGVLIDDLLTFSRLSKKEMRKSRINMNEFVNNIVDEYAKISSHHAKIIVNELPDVLGDENLLSSVLTNLLSNAVKYSFKNEHPVIDISGKKITENNKEFVEYCITDNGIGFDMLYVNKLFGVFQRLHNEKEYPGTGVGLAISKRIIDKHDGKIWAKGELGKGSSFCFSLPC